MSINFVCSAVVIDSRLQQDFLTKAAHNMANISILLGISILKYEKKNNKRHGNVDQAAGVTGRT